MDSKKLRNKIMNALRSVFTVPVAMARFRNCHYLVYISISEEVNQSVLRDIMGKPLEKSR